MTNGTLSLCKKKVLVKQKLPIAFSAFNIFICKKEES